jgi:hypothetical protein
MVFSLYFIRMVITSANALINQIIFSNILINISLFSLLYLYKDITTIQYILQYNVWQIIMVSEHSLSYIKVEGEAL